MEIEGGSQPPKNRFIHEYKLGYTRLIQIRDFKNDNYLTYVPDKFADRPFNEEDIMIGRYGPPVFQILRGKSGTYNVALMKAEPLANSLSKDYLYYLLSEPRIQNKVISESERTAGQSGVRKELLYMFCVCIPPIEEQNRIVEKVNELMVLCDRLEDEQTNNLTTHQYLVKSLLEKFSQANDADELQTSWEKISHHFDMLFCTDDSIEQLKQSLLTLVIQGHFRTQDTSDNPATALYELIQEELTGKYGKSFSEKLERDKSTIEPSDFHVAIPESWVWCELQDLAIMFNGKAHEQFVDDNGAFILVNSSFVSSEGKSAKFVSSQLTPLSKGDIAIVMSDVPDGNALVKCYLVEEDNKYTLNQRIGGIKTSSHININYLFLVLNRNRYYLQYNDGKKQSNLKKIQILSCPIPLPPVEEQGRIVSKVEELFAMCDSLKEKIIKAKEIKVSLSKSVVQLV